MTAASASGFVSGVHILADGAALARRAAQIVVESAAAAVREKGTFSIALAGGSTPKALYNLLASDSGFREQMPWAQTQFFFGDERHAGPDQPESNFRMANEAMLSKVELRPQQVHRIKGEYADTERAALEYEGELRLVFGLEKDELPRFDLILLGMGSEGHTLSLFPGTKALHDNTRLVVRNWVGKLYTERVTITARVANNAKRALFMVAGADKALVLKGVLEGPREPEQLPAQLIQPTDGQLLWLVDQAAGGMLTTGIRE
ncbi:MAG TPA: 6-phosphogluconolactonase [Candidatus Acidoferrales bacterium]|nr:6-phosphogluconolactonase [Candidatus Acidoferrales bacterium]